MPAQLYRFGGHRIDVAAGRLTRDGTEVPLQPLTWKLLLLFVRSPGVVLAHDALQEELWPSVSVTGSSLVQLVRRLRLALGPDGGLVESLPRRGYRFVGEVTVDEVADRPALPPRPDAFVGRVAELSHLRARLDAGDRLLVLVGPPGVGKSRLAWELARQAGRAACVVHAAAATDAASLEASVAGALGLADGADVGAALAGRGDLLVVLDDVERLVEAARAALLAWRAAAPEAAFVVTSRAVLGVPGERLVPIEPLPAEDATVLLSERSGAALEATRSTGALVEALDGLPLAIELAAPRLRLLSPDELLARLGDPFAVLRGPGARSLEAALDASWEGLSPADRGALGALATFEAPFTPEAAAAVIGDDALDRVQALADRSLLQTRVHGDRLRLLGTVRAYARRRADPAELERAVVRHGRFFARLADEREAADLPQRPEGAESEWLAATRAAVARGDGEVAERVVVPLCDALRARGEHDLAIELLEAVEPLAPTRRSLVLSRLARALKLVGRAAEARVRIEAGIAAAREEGDARAEAALLLDDAQCLRELERYDEARAVAGVALRRTPATDRARRVVAHSTIAAIAWRQGDVEGALEHDRSALQVATELGDPALRALALGNLGLVLSQVGHPDEAVAILREALAINRQVGDRTREARVLGTLATLEARRGDAATSLELQEQAAAIAEELGIVSFRLDQLANLGVMRVCHGQLESGAATLRHALALAEATENGAAVGFVLGWLADAHTRMGRRVEALALAERAVALVGDGEPVMTATVRLLRARALAESGLPDQAEADLAVAEPLYRSSWCLPELVDLLLLRIRLRMQAGDPVADLLEEAEVTARRAWLLPDSHAMRELARLRRA